VSEILMKSSNIGSAKMALRMNDQTYYDYVRRYGFGEKTGIPLQGEISGMVNPPHRWDKLTKTRMAFGQSVAVTPIQVVMAMSTIANGGKLMKPRLVLSEGEGSSLENVAPVREVVSKKSADFVATALQRVVSNQGTAPLAHIEGYTVAGKTGTAQKIGSHGGYQEGRYIVSFAGFFPADAPRLTGLVILNDARVSSEQNYGGIIAAPIFSSIGSQAARYLDIPPESSQILAQSGNVGTTTGKIR
jgi:cell division protein FtsI/penicillin-binding protein 2